MPEMQYANIVAKIPKVLNPLKKHKKEANQDKR